MYKLYCEKSASISLFGHIEPMTESPAQVPKKIVVSAQSPKLFEKFEKSAQIRFFFGFEPKSTTFDSENIESLGPMSRFFNLKFFSRYHLLDNTHSAHKMTKMDHKLIPFSSTG